MLCETCLNHTCNVFKFHVKICQNLSKFTLKSCLKMIGIFRLHTTVAFKMYLRVIQEVYIYIVGWIKSSVLSH